MDKKEKPVNIHAGHRQRLRENVLKNGLENMHEHQVLEYLLTFVVPQKDVNELAHRLIQEFGNFANVLESDITQLKRVKGVGEVIAHFIYNFRHMFYYYQKNKLQNVATLTNTIQTVKYFKNILSNKLVEELYLVGVDYQNRVVYSGVVEYGNSNRTNVTIRKITDIIIKNNLNNVILGHNHPSGKALPSKEDDVFTKNVFMSLASNDIHLLDHIIIGESDIYSYYQDHKIDNLRDEFKKFSSGVQIAQPLVKYDKCEDFHEQKVY